MLRVRNLFSLFSKAQQIGYFCSAQPPKPPNTPQQQQKPPQQYAKQFTSQQSPPKSDHNAPRQINSSQKQSAQPTQKGQQQQELRSQNKSKSPETNHQQNQFHNRPKDQQQQSQRWQSDRPTKWQPPNPKPNLEQSENQTPKTQDEELAEKKKTLFGFKPQEQSQTNIGRDQETYKPKNYSEFRDIPGPSPVRKEKFQPKFEPKKTAVLFSATEQPKTRKVTLKQGQSRQYNVILKRTEISIMNEKQLASQLFDANKIDDPTKKSQVQIEGFALSKDYLKMDEVFEQQPHFNSGVFQTYILFLFRLQRLRKAKTILLQYQKELKNVNNSVFKLIFKEIFTLELQSEEKADLLNFLYQLTDNMKIDYNISEFDNLFKAKIIKPEVVKVFNLYFNKFVELHKQKHQVVLPDALASVFSSAVEILLLENNASEVETLIRNVKILQQPIEDKFEIEDLTRYAVYLTQQQGGFQKILELVKQIKNPNFIFSVELGLKRLDLLGMSVEIIDKETLENLYLERKEHLRLRQAELFCCYADRVQHYSMVADIFQNQNQNKQNEYSSFIYQKSLDVIINASEGVSLSNAVVQSLSIQLSLAQEAQEKHVALSDFYFSLAQIKALIKEGNLELVYKLFTENVIQDVISAFQKQKLTRFFVKYIQNQYIGKKYRKNYPKKVYDAKISSAVRFVQSLSDETLMSMYKKDKSDNLLLEGICGQEDLFEYTKGVVRREEFKRIQSEILNGSFDYTKILDPKTEQEFMERDIIDNYQFYIQKEKLFRIAQRRRKLIRQILKNINMKKLKWRTKTGILKEVYKVFPKKKLEQGLLYGELIEFPELELVQQIQIKVQRESPKKYSAEQIQTQEIISNQEEIEQEDNNVSDNSSQIHDVLHEKPIEQIIYEAKTNMEDELDTLRMEKQKFVYQRSLDLLQKLRKYKRKLSGRGKFRFQKFTQNRLIILSYFKAKQLEKSLALSRQAQRRFIQMHYKITQHEDNLKPVGNLIKLARQPSRRLSKFQNKQAKINRIYGEHVNETQGDEHFLDVPPSLSSLQQMKYIYYNLYSQYDHQINIPPINYQNEIWDLVAWGIQHKEPMAVKLGEYYCNLTGQKMPEHLVKMIADFYKFGVGETGSTQRNKWLRCLEIINNISTQKVYSHATDPAFVSQQDIQYLMQAGVQQQYKGQVRASLATTYSNRKFVRYGVSQRELLL